MRREDNRSLVIRHIKILVLLALIASPLNLMALPTLPDAANLLYWFSADTDVWADGDATVPATNGNDVFVWRDQKTNFDIEPAAQTAARSPTYVTNGIGGQPSLDFSTTDGDVDSLFSGSIVPAETAKTIFVVFQPENDVKQTDLSQVLFDGWSGKEIIGVGAFHYSAEGAVVGLSSQNLFQGPSVVGVGYGPAKLLAEQPHLLTAVYNETTQVFDLYLDGVNAGNTRKYPTLDMNGLAIEQFMVGARVNGNLSGFQGMISEIIFYQTALSNTDRLDVDSYLGKKYLLPSSGMAFHFSADTDVWADATSTIAATDGVDVQLWRDQSGNGIDLLPSHPGLNRAATYIEDGINGRPALQFNNETSPNEVSPDKMQNTGYSGTLKTLFYVFQPDQPIGNSLDFTQRQVLLAGGSEINTVSPHNQVSSAHIGLNSSDGTANRAWGYDPADDLDISAYPTVLAVSWHDTDDQYDIRVNGASVGNLASGTDPNAFVMNGLYLGAHNSGAYGLQGKLAEVIAYDTELLPSQRNAIEQYLKGKYSAPNTYYVDASSGDDEEDGLSPASAWTSFDRVTNSLLIPGDTILFKRGETWREKITVPSSGAPGFPITFRAYGIGAKPVIHGGRSVLPADWTDMGNGVYSMNSSDPVYFMGEDNELILHAENASCSPGNWFWDDTTDTIYYRPTSGDINGHTVDLVTTYASIFMLGRSYIEFYDLAFTLANRGIYAKSGLTDPIHHVTISNSDFSKMLNSILLWAVNGHENSDSVISDNTFNNNRHSIAIYTAGNGVETNRNFLVTRNTITNGGVAADPQIWIDFLPGDNDGIGLQNLHDSVISYNTITDGLGIHAGIGLFVYSTSSANNVRYVYNYLENILGTGIVAGGQNPNSGGHTVAYNTVINSGLDPVLQPSSDGWGGIRLNATQNATSKVYNNLLVDNDINLYFRGGPDYFQVFNNISYISPSSPTSLHIFLSGNINNNTLDNNLYFPDSSQGFSRNVYGPTNFQGWLGQYYAENQESNSIVADPGFVSATDFHLTANSPAIDPLIDVQDVLGLGNNYLDFDDQFMVWKPDIGPYEYQGTDTDADGVPDIDEICFDGDCTNYDPYDSITNPTGRDLNAFSIDTDGDGYGDGTELTLGFDPLDVGSIPTIVADGDVNLDGQVNVADVLLTQRSMLGLVTLTAEQIAHGDYRPAPGGDGLLGLSDLILIIKTAISTP